MSCYKICFLSTAYPRDRDVLDSREEEEEKGGGGQREGKTSAAKADKRKAVVVIHSLLYLDSDLTQATLRPVE